MPPKKRAEPKPAEVELVVDESAPVVYEEPERVVYYGDTFGAVYFQGKLSFAAGNLDALFWLADNHGYKIRKNQEFHLPFHGGYRVAQSLDEIVQHHADKEDRLRRATELRQQALLLMEEAKSLEGRDG